MARARKPRTDSVPLDPAVEQLVDQIQRAEAAYHNQWSEECDKRWDDYHAIVEEDWDESDWHSHIFPPHLIPIVEGMIAAMVEPKPNLLVTPRPRPMESIEEVMSRMTSAEVTEVAVNWALDNDDFVLKQRPYIHQDIVTGFTVGKYYWDERVKTSYERRFFDSEEEDEFGNAEPVRASEVYSYEEKVRDNPTFNVRDNRDFFWPANCRDLDQADWLADRAYMTMARVRELESLGVFKEGTAAKLEETSLSQQGKPGERRRYDEGGSSGPLRTKGLVEVIERWSPSGVCAVGNRQVLMREDENPFWHGRMPYIWSTAIPNPFQVNGKSIVSVLSPIQAMLWFISNQSLDNLKLLNNLIYAVRSDLDDAESFQWYPGAKWLMDNPEGDVKALEIDPTPATISLQRESLLKGELQNLMGALPGTGDIQSDPVQQKTATGISIITNIAQQVIGIRKIAYQQSFAKIGMAFLDLMQQFMVEPRIIAMEGLGGAMEYFNLDPEALQGAYTVRYDVQGDSMIRQERRAEAQALYQMLTQAAPLQAQFGTPFNLDAIAQRLLKAFDIPNPKVYFQSQEQAQAQMSPAAGMGPPGANGSAPVPGLPGMPAPSPEGQGYNVPTGPTGSPGNGATAPPGPGVSTSPAGQQMLSQTGPR